MDEKLRFGWYYRQDVQQNIVQCIMKRETCFLVPHALKDKEKPSYPVRCIKAWASPYLIKNMQAFDFFHREYNLYHSIFTFKAMPMFSYKPLERKEQQNQFFKDYEHNVDTVMFVMDFDGDKKIPLVERLEHARQSCMKVTKYLDLYHVPYDVVFSGSKGFHLEVRGFPSSRNWKKQVSVFEEIATRLVLFVNDEEAWCVHSQKEDFEEQLLRRFSFDTIDELRTYFSEKYHFDNSIYTSTRIWKCPYSYDVSTDMIVFPLSTEELEEFSIEKYKAENLKEVNLWHRGLLTRQGTINDFWNMADSFGVPRAE